MCELGLRSGGYEGAKRLVGRHELKRGLKALSESRTQKGEIKIRKTWSEQEVDNLMQGLVMCRGEIVGGRGSGGITEQGPDFSEEDFRERMMIALDGNVNAMDHDVKAGLKVLPLCEKLEVRPEGNAAISSTFS